MKRLICLLFFTSVIVAVLYLAILNRIKNNNKDAYIKRECELSTKLKEELLSTRLAPEKFFFTEEGDSLCLDKLVGSKNELLIYRIPGFYCSSCVDRELELINNINKDELLPVIVLTHFYKFRDFKVFAHYNASEKIIFCNSGDKFLSIDSLSKSYYIILNNEFVIERAFFPVKLSVKQSYDFLKSL